MRLSNIAAIGRVGLVSVLGIIIVIATVGVYAYTDTSQMTAAKTTSTTLITSSNLTSASSACTQIGTGNIFLSVKSSSAKTAIQGVPVQIKEISGECPGEVLNLGNFTTDADGTVMAAG